MKKWIFVLPGVVLLLIFSRLDLAGGLPAASPKTIPMMHTGSALDYLPVLEDLPQGYYYDNDLLPRTVRTRLRPFRHSVIIQGFDRTWVDQSGLPLKVLYGVILLSGAASNSDLAAFTRYDNLIQEGMELIKPPADDRLTWDSEPVGLEYPACSTLSVQKILSDAGDGNVYLFAHCQMDNLIIMLWLRLRAADVPVEDPEDFLADQVKLFLDVISIKAQMRQEGLTSLDRAFTQ